MELSLASSGASQVDQPGLAHRPKRSDEGTFPALMPVLDEEACPSLTPCISITLFHSRDLSWDHFVKSPSEQALCDSHKSKVSGPSDTATFRQGNRKLCPMSHSTAVSQFHDLRLRHLSPGLRWKQMDCQCSKLDEVPEPLPRIGAEPAFLGVKGKCRSELMKL